MNSEPNRPLPPADKSLRVSFENQWELIIRNWQNGWIAESMLDSLDHAIEFHRVKIFERGEMDDQYDWKADWFQARLVHDSKVDFVKNRKKYADDLRDMWSEWSRDVRQHFSTLSIEALRSMVLVNGAAIIAALAILSGQIDSPKPIVITVAKVTVFTSVVSLGLMATGHGILFDRLSGLHSRVRGVLVGFPRHRQLRAISRYLGRYGDPVSRLANALIYGSIIVFCASALICSLMLFAT